MANTRDGKRPKPVSLPRADAVLDPGVGAVAGFQELDRAAAGGGVGGEDLVAHAFDGVEQGQLRAGVRAFAAHDEPGAVRVAGSRSAAAGR